MINAGGKSESSNPVKMPNRREGCAMVEIDGDRCTSCGRCAEVCPSGIIASERVDGGGRVFVAHGDWCNLCGHCMAVCEPHAVGVRGLSYDDVVELDDPGVTPGQVRNLLLARRSVRRYSEDPVGDRELDDLVEVATHAGTGGNLQTVGFVVVRDRALIRQLERATLDILWRGARLFGVRWLAPLLRLVLGRGKAEGFERYYTIFRAMKEEGREEGAILRNAPAVILAYDLKSNGMGQINCAIAMRNVEIMASSMGLGTCWGGFLVSAAKLRPARMNALVGLGPGDRIYGALMLGRPKYAYRARLPRRARGVKVI
jgi:nitroreductase/NAD-dependent dihydropyrimidine dehydrogenase PreA subunit